MKKIFYAIIAAMMMPMAALADGYTQLWKQYEQARRKDLPRSKIVALDKIAAKAAREQSYGNLLSAEVRRVDAMAELSADSIMPGVRQLEQKAREAEARDAALAAVYYCVVGNAYDALNSSGIAVDAAGKRDAAYRKALANPGMLAAKSALDYQPMVEKGEDSRVFGNDLLSVIGYQTKNYRLLTDHYTKAGNRTAALITALQMVKTEYENTKFYTPERTAQGSAYMQRLDSLVGIYGDLPECGEVAIARYEYMCSCSDVTKAQKADFIDKATKRWAAWRNIPRLKSEYQSLVRPMYNVTLNTALRPGVCDTVRVEACNIKGITLAVTRLDMSGECTLRPDDAADWKRLKAMMMPKTKVTVEAPFTAEHPYDTKTLSVELPKLKPGLYVVEVSAPGTALEAWREIVAVSDVCVATMALPEGKTRIAVLNATTGQPVAGAKISVELSNGSRTSIVADAKGEAVFTQKSFDMSRVRAYTAADNYMQYIPSWGNFSFYGNKRKLTATTLFTDRAIYRPGQTVHVSAVAYQVDGLHSSAVVGQRELTFQLLDANNKMLEEKKATTDDFGTAAVSFTLPAGGTMNGRFSVRCNGNSTERKYFRVEEYKRPTFEVRLDEVKEEYHNGDTVTVSGTALTYAGAPVQGARVAYRVKRSEARWFWRYYGGSDADRVMITDTVTTDADGRFSMRVPVVMPQGYTEQAQNGAAAPRCGWHTFYTFTASAQITDNAGESHDAETALTLGTQPTSLTFDMPEKALRDSVLNVRFRRLNASAKEMEGNVAYWFDNQSKRYTAKANETLAIDWTAIEGMASGRHRMYAACGSDTLNREFVLFSLADRQPAAETPDWAYVSAATFPADGKPVYVQVGSSCADTHILYSLIAGKKVLESGAMEVSNGIITTPYIYKEEYGEGILLNYLWVKDGVAYTHRFTIARPMQDKSLVLKWKTFRDKLTPGQKETWTLNISRPEQNDIINRKYTEGEQTGSQLLALMYDKSLDQIARNPFTFSLPLWQNQPSTRWMAMTGMKSTMGRAADVKWFSTKDFRFNHFITSFDGFRRNWLVGATDRLYTNVVVGRPEAMLGSSKHNGTKELAAGGSALSSMERSDAALLAKKENAEEERPTGMADAGANGGDGDAAGTQAAAGQIRENLQETAFFYPALFADKDGNVDISFTLPESVTTWNFRGWAHDRNMNFGSIESTAVASKKVMVMPNVPRFVRTGDKASIPARVVNTTGSRLTATVRMQLIDPETDKTVYTKAKKLTVDANSTASVVFDYAPEGSNALLICRISAEGKDYSDGEQHYLPVLPATERVVNTVPFTFSGKGEKSFAIDGLFPKNAVDRKLTVEYTTNPAWMMIQALPYVAQADDKNAVSLAAAYYANVLGRHIMEQNPVIKRVVELWKKEDGSAENSLMSALQKNQELKTLVLDETPWVMDADKEADQKRILSTYFDESAITYRIASLLDALHKLQKDNGAWSWWTGMDGSPSMTAQVVEMLARLKQMSGDKNADAMIGKAMHYLDGVVVKEYEEMKKIERKGKAPSVCDSHAIQYLYINALLDRTLTGKEREAKNYVLSYLRKDRQRNIYAKALIAVVLQKEGKTQEAKEYVESIRQYTVSKPGMGCYFDTRRAAYSWVDYRIPTQTAAIEAIKAVEPADRQTVNEMRLWLLQSKRTQAWSTPINSVNAVYAFVDGNVSELGAKAADAMKVTVDGKQLAMPAATAGLGYARTSLAVGKQKKLTVASNGGNAAWGAAYAQYSQNAADVDANASGLKVEREVLRVAADGSAAAAQAGTLAVGSRIRVRITVVADRDYDFVQLVDKRAACMEPVEQTSGYRNGCFFVPKDNATHYYFDRLAKGRHTVETEYYIDRSGNYSTGICTVQCAYAPEFTGRTGAGRIGVE